MKSLMLLLKSFFCRLWMLFLLTFLLLSFIVSENKVNVRILNYLRDSSWYINRYAEGIEAYDEFKFIESLEYYQKINEIMPKLPLAHGMLGYVYYHLGMEKHAVNSFNQAISFDSQFFGFYYNMGIAYFKNGEWQKAHNILKRGVQIDPERSIVYYNVAAEKRFKDESSKKAWISKQLNFLKEGYLNAYKMIIVSYDKQGKYESMYAVAKGRSESLKKDSDFFHFYAGKAAIKLGQENLALYHFNECIKVNSNYIDAYKYLVDLTTALGKGKIAQIYKIKLMKLENKQNEFDQFDGERLKIFYYIPA